MTPLTRLHEKLFIRESNPFWIQRAGDFLAALNVLHLTTTVSAMKFYFIGLFMGVVLLAGSLVVGMASFWVEIEIQTADEKFLRLLDLGYLSQMNYGSWYLIFCPVLLALVALAYDAMRRAQQSFPSMLPSFERLGKTRWVAAVGIVVLGFFVFKNIIVEWDDYKNLSLGWVQAKPLQDYRDEIAKTNAPIDLVARKKKFDRFLLPKEERFIQKDEIRSIKILRIDPNLHVRSFWSMILFILITKLWVGLWEAIVIYFAILALTWGLMGARYLDLPALKDASGAFYHLSWIRRPAFYIFLVGLFVNLFCIFRYTSNAAKGSYGKWDQYWSLLVFSPALFLIPVFHILATIYNSSENEDQAYLSKRGVMAASVWMISFAYVIYLVLGYINPRQQTVLVACFKPFISGLKKMLGL